MSRAYARDIKKAVKDWADTYFNAMFTTIDTERSESLASKCQAKRIDYFPLKGKFPEVLIQVNESNKTAGPLPLNIETIDEDYTVTVTAYITDFSSDLDNIADNYEEAFKRVFPFKNILAGWFFDLVSVTKNTDTTEENRFQTKITMTLRAIN